ncbi:ribonuclease domain-containing protein [Stomatobaculum longum]|uniref:ribonuclease domain-containing protein n=1 Tax=Stomatobaculum longum TaxID=796942 RepID=UPI0028E8EB69|nr:ribonuclease domain-containing protein [Stomatobaculum longum]
MRGLRRLLVLLPVLFLLAGCASRGSGTESRAESQSEQTALATEAESTQRESSESGTAKSKKKQKKKKKSKGSQKSGKRQSDGAASAESEAGTSEALSSTAAEETRTAEKRTTATRASERDTEAGSGIREDGSYTSRDEVALYLQTYGKLPKNFISKKDAEEQGFRFGEGDFGEAFPGMSVGGSRFGNYEGQLPEKSGRRYYECDIDYQGGRRNAKRLVYSNDGLIFYTDDHYKSFTQLY